MTGACQFLHVSLAAMPVFNRDDLSKVPLNGIYVLFEKGEHAHSGERIVRVGTHRGQNNLRLRIREHLYTQNKDRSIFRKHVGRCLLAKKSDAFLAQWEIDLTTKAAREKFGHLIDKARMQEVENEVTRYMSECFSFATLSIGGLSDRLETEESLLSTIHHCRECGPSESWLGRFHPKSEIIRNSGLWNVQSMNGAVLELDAAKRVLKLGH